MKKRRRRFDSEVSAHEFANKVDGKVNDLRNIENAKSKFTVTYTSCKKTKLSYSQNEYDRCPEDNRDFGYSNDFWQ